MSVKSEPAPAHAGSHIVHADMTFTAVLSNLTKWARAIRVHQWVKNLLLFVPLLAAHQIMHFDAVALVALAVIAFSLCASSAYIINDLIDLDNDRQHPQKRHRSLASCAISKRAGIVLAPFLSVSSFLCAAFIGQVFLLWVAGYFLLSCAYSCKLKKIVLVDCVALGVLYTIRVIAGASAADVTLSFWLLVFSGFLFFSLAFLKRFAELQVQQRLGREFAPGRGYFLSDAPLIQLFGVASGYASVLVLALYLNGETVVDLYRAPYLLWSAVPLTLLWISWMWLKAHRGQLHDDPLIFTVKDPCSLAIGFLCLAIGVLATFYGGQP